MSMRQKINGEMLSASPLSEQSAVRREAAKQCLRQAILSVGPDQPRLLNIVTSSLMVGLLPGQLQYFRDRGFDVTIISPGGRHLDEVSRIEGIRTIEVPLARTIAPLSDLASLFRLWHIVRTLRPMVTNVGTPKAGLLGGFAAWLNRVPCRFYTLRGLRFETTAGLKRRLLIYVERLACCFAHRVICVSHSVRERAIASGLTSPERMVVFGSGSSNGVDASRFAPTLETVKRAEVLRSQLNIPPQAPVVGFVGRFTRDKGIPELVKAFLQLTRRFPELRLLLLGRFEEQDALPFETRRCLATHPNVVLVGHAQQTPLAALSVDAKASQREDWPVEHSAPYYAVMDILVLPTHREGLPNVVLEAQAAGRPVVASRATGVVDVIRDGETGLLFPVGDVHALATALTKLLTDRELAKKLARSGQARVKREFRQEQVWGALHQEYVRLLRARTSELPGTAHRTGLTQLMAHFGNSSYAKFFKRILDILVSGIAMVLLCPMLVLVATLIIARMGRPVLFCQRRPGYQANLFTLYKFRTLSNDCDSDGNLLPDPDRLTSLGSFLRRWSLDELPQLWNILKGDMSLVGPRPLLVEYLQKYTPEQARRHDVRPGLTGWAQLHGRQNLLFSKRLEMDVWYVDHWSFLLDVKLILATLARLHKLSAVGANTEVNKTDDLGFFALIQKQKPASDRLHIS